MVPEARSSSRLLASALCSAAFAALFSEVLIRGPLCQVQCTTPLPGGAGHGVGRRAALRAGAAAATSAVVVAPWPRPAHAALVDGAEGLKYEILEAGEAGADSPSVGDTVFVDTTAYLLGFGGKGGDPKAVRFFPPNLPRMRDLQTGLPQAEVNSEVLKEVVGGSPSRPQVPGVTMTLTSMKKGERRRVVIPPALGYGDAGSAYVPPGATMYYELTLLDWIPKKDPKLNLGIPDYGRIAKALAEKFR